MPVAIMSRPVRRWRPSSTSWSGRRRPGWRPCGRKRSRTATAAASRVGDRGEEKRGVEMSEEEGASSGRYVVVKALEDGVVIMGLTRGKDTRSHHSERLDAGEGMVAQFTELTAAIKIRGRAEILTDVGWVESGS